MKYLSSRLLGLFVLMAAYLHLEIAHSAVDFPPFSSSASSSANLTVVAGREIRIPCSVDDALKDYKVAWSHYGPNGRAILATGIHVLTKNPRVAVISERDTNTLVISNVIKADRGDYVCQTNAPVPEKSVSSLEVVVPPGILNPSSDVTVSEGETASLSCEATGDPTPKLTWRREDRRSFVFNNTSVRALIGSDLEMKDVSRDECGAYLCVASNGIPPAVSARIQLFVKHSPVLLGTSRLKTAAWAEVGQGVALKCEFSAWPRPTISWTLENKNVGMKPFESYSPYGEGFSTLLLKQVTLGDFGEYVCTITNALGKVSTTVALLEIIVTTTISTSSTTSTEKPTPPATTKIPSTFAGFHQDLRNLDSVWRDLEDRDFRKMNAAATYAGDTAKDALNSGVIKSAKSKGSEAGPLYRYVQDQNPSKESKFKASLDRDSSKSVVASRGSRHSSPKNSIFCVTLLALLFVTC